MKIKALVAGVALVAVGGQAMAATDGTYGATSQGTAVITATVGNMVRVSAIQDVTLTAAGGWAATGGACVFNNVGSAYNVTLSTGWPSATPAEFNLSGPSGLRAYTVNWNGVAASNAVSQAATGATAVADCGAPGNTNATYSISAAASFATLPATGVYTDTLTILVAP